MLKKLEIGWESPRLTGQDDEDDERKNQQQLCLYYRTHYREDITTSATLRDILYFEPDKDVRAIPNPAKSSPTNVWCIFDEDVLLPNGDVPYGVGPGRNPNKMKPTTMGPVCLPHRERIVFGFVPRFQWPGPYASR
ncbi:hypothetical protein M0802_013203 [Mischocyttarus mexicanus]|nr:hypothetical protein M0802_013208 [Mischocyttarus mexicanus]KAI4483914.1 hypothetical protein M0802_013203 [Mischocyttarus mexicanus]